MNQADALKRLKFAADHGYLRVRFYYGVVSTAVKAYRQISLTATEMFP
jgi:hypothetical protein